MKSLEELNQYALSPITYTDNRPAEVFFDRGATEDQYIEVNENTTFFFPYGIEIEDITQYDIAQIEYVIDLSAFTSNAVYISWPSSITLPSYITVTRVANVFTIAGMRSRSDWDLVKAVRVQPPFSISGFKPLEGKLTWFANASATTRTEAVWDVQLNLIPVEYFSPTALELYTASLQDQQIASPDIIVDPDEFDPEWTLEISPSVLSAVQEIYSTSVDSNATASWNNTTKTYTIVGDKTAVNNTLDGLEVDYARSDVDFTFLYLLRNNFNLVTESQIQVVESRDFISDIDMLSSLDRCILYVIWGGVSNQTSFTTFDDVDYIRYRATGANAPAIATQETNANGIFDASATMSASFEQEPILNFDLEIESTLSCDAWVGEAIEYTLDVAQTTVIYFNLVEPADGQYLRLISDNGDDAYWADGTSRPGLNTVSPGTYTYKITGYADNSKGINWNNIRTNTYTVDIHTFGGDVSNKMKMQSSTHITSFPDRLHPNFRDLSECFVFAGSKPSSFFAPVTSWDVSNVTNMSNMFRSAVNFNEDITGWNTSSVTNMSSMFNNADSFNQPIGVWDTSSVTNMGQMFAYNNTFNQSLSSWDTSNVETFYEMFYGATSFNEDLSGWDFSSATSLSRMFGNATAFNHPSVTTWNTSTITNLSQMFLNASSFNQNINGWDVSNVVTMFGVFQGASSFNQSLNSWDTSSVTGMSRMFEDASSFNGAIGSWDVSNVGDFSYMFDTATGFNQNINNWNVSKAYELRYMFQGATAYNQPMDTWYPANLAPGGLTAFLLNASAYNQDLSHWCVPNVTSAPSNFATNTPLTASQLPVWGTCPWSGTITGYDYSYSFTDADGISWKSYVYHNSNTGSNARTATISGAKGYAQLIITGAGGHGGGSRSTDTSGGGGGGGGVATNIITNKFAKITDGTYNFTIGQADTTYIQGNAGGSTTAFGYTVPGGGNGASYGFNGSPQVQLGADGASGGGATWYYGVETRGESVSTGYVAGDLGLTGYLDKYDGKSDGDAGFSVSFYSMTVDYAGGGASVNISNQNKRAYNHSQSSSYGSWSIPLSGLSGPFGGEGLVLPTRYNGSSDADTYGSGGGGSMGTGPYGSQLNWTIPSYGGYNGGNGAVRGSQANSFTNAGNGADGFGGGGGGGSTANGGSPGRGGCGSVVIRVQA